MTALDHPPSDATLTIRPPRETDWPAVHALLRHAIAGGDSLAAADDTPEAALRAEWFETPLATRVACLTGVPFDDQPMGIYRLKANQPGRGGHVANCGYVVSPAARGLGVATRLCRDSQAVAVALGFRAMQFNLVVSTNTVAVRLWQRLGFSIVGTVPAAYHHRTLGDVDVHVLHKRLATAAGGAESAVGEPD